MRIIKEGKQNSEGEKFICKKCGCEFVCLSDEFWVDKVSTMLSVPAQYVIFASCPNCHKVCSSTKMDYTKHSITLNAKEESVW